VVLEVKEGAEITRLLTQVADAPGNKDARRQVDALMAVLADTLFVLDPRRRKPIDVGSVIVPVFSPMGDVVMTVTAAGFGAAILPDQVVEIGNRMRATADAIALLAYSSPGGAARLSHAVGTH
jgi:DNA-binding IclR family transcriptional regulator